MYNIYRNKEKRKVKKQVKLMEQKMTYVAALALAIEAVQDEEVKEKLIALKAAQEKRATARKPRVNTAKLELADRAVEVMEAGVKYRAKDLADMLDVTTQKLAPAMKVAVEAGHVEKIVEKRVTFYQLAEDEVEEED
jgi:gamma-glutamylcysteine synthetase